MATVRPFRALRPAPADAARIASPPYDVVTTDEARTLAAGNPLSFLHVSRAEIDLPADADPHADAVYDRAAENFDRLKPHLVVEPDPSLYVYEIDADGHRQAGIAGCYSLDEYDRDVVKKHERTRRDKEDDRTRHMLALGAQTGPVFLTYRASEALARLAADVSRDAALFDVQAAGARHRLWRASGRTAADIVSAMAAVPALYIADGHHRAASAARARVDIRDRGITRTSLGDGADYTTFLGVAFPDTDVRILAYNRAVSSLGHHSLESFMEAVRARFDVQPGPPMPRQRGDISMLIDNAWHTIRPRARAADAPLDVTMLERELLAPVLDITDIRTDKRIEFVGSARGVGPLEERVASGRAAVAFSLFPVSVSDLMAVCDAGGIMPPKSTWFEPKLCDGLLIHLI